MCEINSHGGIVVEKEILELADEKIKIPMPGDIIGSMAGKTIEVLNTDAEGRFDKKEKD